MKVPTPAPAADPGVVAQKQAEANKQTAITQSELNQINQVTPYGNLTYTQTGVNSDGTPQFTATQTLSPEEQGLFNLGQQTRQNIGNIGVEQSANIRNLLNKPVDLSTTATEGRLDELGRARLDPQFQQEQARMETDLINKGIRPGSQAWQQAQTQFAQNKNDAYNQLYLTGHQTGVSDILAERNQPINEITALLSNSQVQQPNYVNTPTSGVAPTDVIGAVGQNYNQQNVGFNAANQQYLGAMSGLFGLGKTALGGWGMTQPNYGGGWQ